MAPNPDLYAHCANCGVPVVTLQRRRRVCKSCQNIAQVQYRAERTRPRPAGQIPGSRADASYLVTDSAHRRLVADTTLDRGGVLRYCECGRKYRLAAFDTPCPSCATHLIDNPVEAA